MVLRTGKQCDSMNITMQERAPITAADREWRRQRRLTEINLELERLRAQFEAVLDMLAVNSDQQPEQKRHQVR